VFESLRRAAGNASSSARVALVAGMVLVVGLFVFGSYWLLKDDYEVLFADLNASDAAAMVKELDRMKVPYALADEGNTILVERASVYKTRLGLMGKGLDLQGAVGFEIFNNADFGMTEFAQKVNFQRALQGELARTIMGLDEVRQARVHLVLPESGLFRRQNAQPKASVSLVMKGGAELSPERISGIQRLIAASVPSIRPEDVTVLDQKGIALSRAPAADDVEAGGAMPARWETKKQVEEYLVRKIVAVLDRAVGPGKAIVSVDASINYDQVKVTREDVVAGSSDVTGQGVVVRRRDTRQGSDLLDLPAGADARAGAAPSASTTEVEYANGRRVEQVVRAAGGLRHLSVGVLVPGVSDPAELAKLREMVAMAGGIDVDRGDALAVYHVALPESEKGDELASVPLGMSEVDSPDDGLRAAAPGAQNPLIVQMALAIAVLAVAFFVLLWKRKRADTTRKLSDAEREKVLEDLSRWANGAR
jgi:flagellar M-ring protein FliF